MPGVKDFAIAALDNLMNAHNTIIEARVNQTHQANKRQRQEDELVGCARKLMLKFVGPYEIMEAFTTTSMYKLKLPEELVRRRIHPVFHASLLQKHEANDDILFPQRESRVFYDFGEDNEAEWLVEEITSH
ncbi:hypothetical protein JAAARDRAFT_142380 [Jaapia argillacea MUCL 33604]|uniref:Tf2-1-like SH3-like domain-containing protein n=1 Tax=Jaapia argillacea MUCL 33604 TaxID=933084 RepID=A0A067P5C7_9AGAM|nr:hypothetical protein JAAARDRAFT_142380 [Jaapia argillacea MUCL 33604]